jgi:phosphate transport system substrate-binding protein
MSRRLSMGTLLAVLGAALIAPAQPKVDPKLPAYKEVAGVSGRIKSAGSDTMNNLMALWMQGFKKHYPSVETEVEGKGSGTAPPALISGAATFGAMSREMKSKEIDDFKEKFGYAPTGLRTSIDTLAVYVHKDNPIKGLTFPQLDAIFSKTRKLGHKEVRTWGDLGLEGEWADKPISLHGRNSASGTYGYFKEHVLNNGDYKADVKESPGTGGVIESVASEKYAIGYSGIGGKTDDVRPIPIAKKEGAAFVTPEPENAYSGKYPLARFLYVYVNYKPDSELDPLRREFIRYILSADGQADVVKSGYLPIRSGTGTRALESVGLK